MPRNKTRKTSGPEDIPQLKAMGLTCIDTEGHGNCLFHALSDQLYGEQSHHARLRADTVDYMRQHPDDFKAFIVVNQGGGFRRNPKRKNAGALKDTFDLTPPTQAEIDKAYAMSLDNMAKGGTYGEHLESVAFAANFHVNVRIWATGCGAFVHIDCPNTLPGENIPTLYIAHHVYEHYSSIRNLSGPFTGLPEIDIKAVSPEAQKNLERELAGGPPIEEWMIDSAMSSLPYQANRDLVIQTLKQCRGNLNLTVDILLPESSPDTSDRSSSIEREPDSDNEADQKPTKKQDRRQSRPHPLSNHLAVRPKDGDPTSPNPRSLAIALKKVDRTKQKFDPDETEEEDWKEEGPYHDSESASVSTSASDYSTSEQAQPEKSAPRFRLTQPKKPDANAHSSSSERSTMDPQLKTNKQHRIIAKPRRRRLISGTERAADLAKKSARNQHLQNHASANSQGDSTPLLGIKAIKI